VCFSCNSRPAKRKWIFDHEHGLPIIKQAQEGSAQMPIRSTLITTAAAALAAWPLATNALAQPDEPSGGA
jgi:hypothetical protein